MEVNASDKLITLSTCGYDFEGERIVLMARELRDDEKAEDFQGLTVKAGQPHYAGDLDQTVRKRLMEIWFSVGIQIGPVAELKNSATGPSLFFI